MQRLREIRHGFTPALLRGGAGLIAASRAPASAPPVMGYSPCRQERHILERRAEKERELQRGTILGWLRYYGIA